MTHALFASAGRLVAHLAELDARELHLKAGHGSLFAYCRDVLCLSEHEAHNRIEAARAARRFPVILDRLADGSINLTTVRLLAGHLTPDNHVRRPESTRGKRKTEVEGIVAGRAPRPDVATSVRRLPRATPADASPVGPPPPSAVGLVPPPRPATAVALAPDRYRLLRGFARAGAQLVLERVGR